MLDTTAAADSETRRAGRLADIATVEAGGIDALIPQLPKRWLLPANQQRDDLTALMASMARSIGAEGQKNQQRAMLGRPQSLADIAAVEAGGIEALIPQLPGRWLLPSHQQRDDLTGLMASMARSIGAEGQRNQQRAMLGRPESLADLAAVRVPTLVLCGAGDAVTPLADHAAIVARIAGARLVVVPDSGHLSTIEQPAAVTAALSTWLAETPTRSP